MKFEILNLMQHIDSYLLQMGKSSPKELYEPISYFYAIGGKRFRPLLFLLGHSTVSTPDTEAIQSSLLVEKFHNFTLLHDDIMDQAPLRRGKTTIHEKWNQNIAILAGDVMLVHAYNCLLRFPEQRLKLVLQRFNQTAVEVCEGQQWDMNFENISIHNLTKEQYIEMIRLKTAVLLGFSIWAGAIYAGADVQDAEKLYTSAEALGLAFQIKDDWLDVYGDQAKVGKKVGGDILANKKTLLTILTYENASSKDKLFLDDLYSGKQIDANHKIKRMLDLYETYDISSLVIKHIDFYASLCKSAIEQTSFPDKVRKMISDFYTMVLERDM